MQRILKKLFKYDRNSQMEMINISTVLYFIPVNHYSTTVKKATFFLNSITFAYVNQRWHFNKPSDCTESHFSMRNKLAWGMNVD